MGDRVGGVERRKEELKEKAPRKRRLSDFRIAWEPLQADALYMARMYACVGRRSRQLNLGGQEAAV